MSTLNRVCISLAFAAFACGSDAKPAAPGITTGGASGSAGSSSRAGGAAGATGGTDGGTAGASVDMAGASGFEGGVGGGEGGAGTESEGGSGGEPVETTPALCLNPVTIEESHDLELPSPLTASARFGGVSSDELSLVWLELSASDVVLHSVTRSSTSEPWNQEQTQPLPAAFAGVSLSPDGLRIAFVNPDQRGFSLWNRSRNDEAFADAGSAELALVTGEGELQPDERVADPVFAASGLTFLHSRLAPGRERTLYASLRFSRQAPFAPGEALEVDPGLNAEGDAYFAPTGLSADQRTLFVWSAAQNSQLVSFFDLRSRVYAEPVRLPGVAAASPNLDCSRLYHRAGVSPGAAAAAMLAKSTE